VKTVHLRDTSLACIDQGEGDPVIFVHGSLGSFQDFAPQVDFFSRTHRTIAYSRRFHPPNPAPGPADSYSLSEQSGDLAEIIQSLVIGPSTVVASSLGAYVSLICAVRHPHLFSRLILGEPPILVLLEKTLEGRAARGEFDTKVIGPARRAFEEGDEEGGVRAFFNGVAGNKLTFDQLALAARGKLLAAGPALHLELLSDPSEYMPELTDDQIRSVHVPVLLLNGQQSPRVFRLITDQLEQLLSDTYRVLVPSAGHSMQLDNSEFYNAVVREFLATE